MTEWLGPEEWQAVALSLRVSLWATLISLPFGIFTAYALARWRFPGHGLINGLVLECKQITYGTPCSYRYCENKNSPGRFVQCL